MQLSLESILLSSRKIITDLSEWCSLRTATAILFSTNKKGIYELIKILKIYS